MQDMIEIIKKDGTKIVFDSPSAIYEKSLVNGILKLTLEIKIENDDQLEKDILSLDYAEIYNIIINSVELLSPDNVMNHISIFRLSNLGIITENKLEHQNMQYLNVLVEDFKAV